MSYTKTTWVDNSAPAINAENLNKIEQGIYDATEGLAGKVDKVTGKELSSNDFTDAEKTKLEGIDLSTKQDTLVSGTNIKTVNSTSLLGSGDVAVQETLVSGTNIKTINNTSLLGSGNITIQGGGGGSTVSYTPTVSSGTELGKINIDGTDNSVYAPTIPTVDTTMSESSSNAIANSTVKAYIDTAVESIEPGLSDDAKEALLNCFEHVAWIDEHGQTYYTALERALYSINVASISAVFDSQGTTIYTDNTLEELRQYLTVTAIYSDASTEVVTDYTLSGTLVGGNTTITIGYKEKTTTVNITVVDLHNTWTFEMGDNMQIVTGSVDPNASAYPANVFFRADTTNRRNFNTSDGILAYDDYYTYEPTQYFPIPIPAGANRVRIDVEPTGRYIFMSTVKYVQETGRYSNHISANRISWTEVTSSGVTKDLTENNGHLFMNLNSKYDSAGTSYPSNPTKVTITFSEV